MPTDTQKQSLLDAVSNIRSAEQLLVQESRATSDPGKLTQISIEYNQLDSFLSQLLHAQAIADDTDFAVAAASLKKQANTLQLEQKDIEKIVSDIKIAARIVGYVAQALAIIAKI